MKNHRLSLADVLDDCLMYACIGMVALGVLTGEAHCQTLPEAPRAVVTKEVDPSLAAWSVTGAFTTAFTGAITKPWVGLAAGVAVDISANTKSPANMGAALLGSGASYLLIKTLKRDWKKGGDKK